MQIEEAGSLRKHKSEEKRMFLQARRPEGVIRKACCLIFRRAVILVA